MKIDLTGKVALVTASTGGIGFAIARGLAESGAEVIVNGRSVDSVNKGIQALQQVVPGVQVRAAIADLSSQEGVDELLRVASHVDILVNNVGGIIARKWLGEIDPQFWRTVIDVNMTTMLNVTQSALPWLKEATDGASIVNLASLAGRSGGHSGSLVYSMTKGAVLTWTRSLAAELGEFGIRVNAVAPGLILGTRFHNQHTTQASADRTIEDIPLGRAGTPEDIARAICFLASEYDGFISGATLDINGGIYRA